RRAVYWFLQNYADELEVEPLVLRFKPGAERLLAALPKPASGPVEQRLVALEARFAEGGLPRPIARRIAHLETITQTLDIIELAREFGLDVVETGEIYFALGEALRLWWIRERIEGLEVRGRWRAMARATLRETLAQQHRSLMRSLL